MAANALTKLPRHLKLAAKILRHFDNPWLVILLRLGVIKTPYFLYRFHKDALNYTMLARPTTKSSGDIFVLREVMVDETYQEALALVKTRNVRLVDIGAHVGSFTIWAHRVLGVREAFCFEPEPDSFRLLKTNLLLNDCQMVKMRECAVGGASRNIELFQQEGVTAGSNIYFGHRAGREGRTVAVISFDHWLREIEGGFDLLKMDCEGAEWEILRQTDPQQFARFQVVVAEVHDDPEKKQSLPEFKLCMENLGFRTVRWDNKPLGLYVGTR